jgi:hypothetical protein
MLLWCGMWNSDTTIDGMAVVKYFHHHDPMVYGMACLSGCPCGDE